MSCPTASNVGSNLDFTSVPFADYTMIEIKASFTAISVEFAGSEEKRTISTVCGVICAIRRILGARTRVSKKAPDQTAPFVWRTCIPRQFPVRS